MHRQGTGPYNRPIPITGKHKKTYFAILFKLLI